MKALNLTLSGLALGSLVACASAQPSKQLVDARTLMAQAQTSHATKYAPDDLLEAKKLLGKAEDAEDGSPEEIQYAYLADRETRRAEARGNSIYYEEQTVETGAKYTALQEKGRLSAQDQLAATQKDLTDVEAQMRQKDANVQQLGARKAELEAEQRRLSGELSASEAARLDAEKRAASALASLAALANVKDTPTETIITLSGSVLFKTAETSLMPAAKDSLSRVAEALKAMPGERTVVIEGHTDSVGNDDANRKLSQGRADSVKAYLITQGVEVERLTAVGQGEGEPVASNDNPEGRANNRRVELIVKK